MVLLSIPDGRTRTPVKPAEAVKAAEEVAAQRQAKIQADAREAAAVAEKAAAQPKENLKAANKKKKSAQEAVRKEDVSMDDTPVSTKVELLTILWKDHQWMCRFEHLKNAYTQKISQWLFEALNFWICSLTPKPSAAVPDDDLVTQARVRSD